MTTIRQILRGRHQVYSVAPEASVLDALRLMAEKNIGAVVVVSQEKLVGVFSERDYARKVVLQGKTSKDTPVSEVMTAKVITVDPDRTAGECMALMTGKRFRHLPVMENAQLIGVISIGDVVRAVVEEQSFTIKQLESYIGS
jgi:CBS domain-containing protein